MQRDGLYYIKPTQNGPVVPVLCSNGYTMIDLSLDAHLQYYPSYLSSYSYSRDSLNWILPILDDLSTFKQWWKPSNSDADTKFRVALDCKRCETSTDFGDNVVYYTDSSLFCFASTPSAGCVADLNAYACNVCDVGTIDSEDILSRTWTKCSALQMASDTPINYDHDQCVTHGLVYRPVLSRIRDACTCYQPSATNNTTYVVSSDELPAVTMSVDDRLHIKYIDESIIFEEEEEDDVYDACEENIVYLNNDDFIFGTYRIQECGEYIFTQDIILNFNAPSQDVMSSSDFSPNDIDIDDLHWFPTHAQHESGAYEGTYSYSGSYSLGFFAGITIESDNVSINLNGFSLRMDSTFYLQQRYFTLIECGAKYFLPNQGPSNWLIADEFYASNVEISGGRLGLSSHHAIHGMRNNNLYIHDIVVTAFEVAGIQCNGCNNVHIESATIGPQNTNIPVVGRYAHARAMLPRLKQLNDEYGSESITFSGRPEAVTISDLIYRLIDEMDMIYNHIINNLEYDEYDSEWISARELFLNPSGWMDGGSSYGVVFSGDGAAVVGMGSRIQDTSNIMMNDVEIFGIYNQVREKIKVSVNKVGATRLILFDTIDWIAVTDSIEDGSSAQYVGDAYTDLIFAIKQQIVSWSYLNSLYLTDAELQYVFEGNNEENQAFRQIWEGGSPANSDQNATGCNTDIQLHSSKGAIGLRFDGTQNISIQNINIHDVVNWADLGANWCGLADGPSVSNEDSDIQYGYTGTRAHGLVVDYVSGEIQNVEITNIESLNGEAIALNVYKGCDVQLININVSSVRAGSQLSSLDVDQLTLPNLIPRACAIQVHNNTEAKLNHISQNDVYGHENCLSSSSAPNSIYYSTFGMLLICTICFCFIVIVIKIKEYCCNKNDDNKKKKSTEYTPLLI